MDTKLYGIVLSGNKLVDEPAPIPTDLFGINLSGIQAVEPPIAGRTDLFGIMLSGRSTPESTTGSSRIIRKRFF